MFKNGKIKSVVSRKPFRQTTTITDYQIAARQSVIRITEFLRSWEFKNIYFNGEKKNQYWESNPDIQSLYLIKYVACLTYEGDDKKKTEHPERTIKWNNMGTVKYTLNIHNMPVRDIINTNRFFYIILIMPFNGYYMY